MLCVKKGFLKNFAKFTEKHLCRFFNKDAGLEIYQKRDSDMGAFLRFSQNFSELHFTEHLRDTASVNGYFFKILLSIPFSVLSFFTALTGFIVVALADQAK